MATEKKQAETPEVPTVVAESKDKITTASGVQVWLVKHTGKAWCEPLKDWIDQDVPGQWQVMIQTKGRIDAGMKPTRWALVCDHHGAPVNRDTNIQLPPQFDQEVYEATKRLMPTCGKLYGSSMPPHLRDGQQVEL